MKGINTPGQELDSEGSVYLIREIRESEGYLLTCPVCTLMMKRVWKQNTR